MKTYIVEVTRKSFSTKYFKVKAKNREEAKDIAIDEAGSYEFPEHDAEYEASDCLNGNCEIEPDVDLTEE